MAKRLSLTGHARNNPDGSVEVLACGEAAALSKLADWLWQGSPASSVTHVDRVDMTMQEMNEAELPRSSFTTG